MKVREAIAKTRDGLPREVFAIVGDPEDPETWKLPHHKKSILRALKAARHLADHYRQADKPLPDTLAALG